MGMRKTQVYLPEEDLRELHRIARKRGRAVADLVREAIQIAWLKPRPRGPVDLWTGELHGTSADHDAAFDDS
jgi:hypothetical protein